MNIKDFENKVICGDCLEVMKGIPDNSVDLIVTDPPYNTGMSQKKTSGSTRLSHFFDDDYIEEDYQKLVDNCCKEFWRLLKDDKRIYIFMNWKEYPRWFYALSYVGFTIKACIVWDKMIHGLGSQYKYTHEFIIFAVKGNPLIKQPGELSGYYKDIWRVQRMNYKNKEHDTQKPIKIMWMPISHGSDVGEIILDPFIGSGTAGVAAYSLGRKYIGIELNPKYVKIAEARIKAVKVENKLPL